MIIAHEYPLIGSLFEMKLSKAAIFKALYQKSYDEFISGWRGEVNVRKKGYSLSLRGLWQATFEQLKVIGNKHGGTTVQLYRKKPEAFFRAMEYLKATLKIPIYAIHVVRNPFDMIATQTLYMDTGKAGVRTEASEQNKFNKTKLLSKVALDMIARMKAATELIGILDFPTLEIRSESLIHDPVGVMSSICNFVGVAAIPSYLQACNKRTFSSSTKSRNTVVWPQALIDLIQEQIKDIQSFQHYTFS